MVPAPCLEGVSNPQQQREAACGRGVGEVCNTALHGINNILQRARRQRAQRASETPEEGHWRVPARKSNAPTMLSGASQVHSVIFLSGRRHVRATEILRKRLQPNDVGVLSFLLLRAVWIAPALSNERRAWGTRARPPVVICVLIYLRAIPRRSTRLLCLRSAKLPELGGRNQSKELLIVCKTFCEIRKSH